MARAVPLRSSTLQGAAVTLEDNTAPAHDGERVRSWRPAGASQSDTVTVNATDNSGIEQLRLDIGGQLIVSRPFACDYHAAASLSHRAQRRHA